MVFITILRASLGSKVYTEDILYFIEFYSHRSRWEIQIAGGFENNLHAWNQCRDDAENRQAVTKDPSVRANGNALNDLTDYANLKGD